MNTDLDWQIIDQTSGQRGRPKKRQDSKLQISTFQRQTTSGRKSQSGLNTKTYWLTDCQSQSNSESDYMLSHSFYELEEFYTVNEYYVINMYANF
jgi:hypothetical protein